MKDLWKYIGTGALSMLLTLTGAWFTVNAQAVTKTQVQEMIAPDRDVARQTLAEVRELRNEINHLNREIGELRGRLGK